MSTVNRIEPQQDQVSAESPRVPATAEAEYLAWLWRTLCSSDGTSAVCVKCGEVRRFHRVGGRRAYACDRCGAHVHPTRGTFLEGSKLRLAVWFRAVPLVLSAGPELSAVRLADELGVTQRTASRIKRVLLTAAAEDGPDARLIESMWRDGPQPGGTTCSPDALLTTTQRNWAQESRTSPAMERITSAACRAFAERGVAATRVADIAREAGVSSAIIHYYFRSKDQVLLAALRWVSGRQAEQERVILAGEPDHMARVRTLVEMAVPRRQVLRDEYRLWLEMYLVGRHQPALLQECAVLSDRWRTFIERIIVEGTAAGIFHPVAPAAEIAHRLVNLFDGFGFRLVVDYSTTPYELAGRLTRRFVAEQLGLPPGSL